MILSDGDIKKAIREKRLVIEPFDETCVQPSSYDLKLASQVRVFDNHKAGEIDVRNKQDISRVVKINGEGFVLHPGEFILGSTVESFAIPRDLAGKLEGKSSLARLGLVIHATAGYVDPGFKGQLTFEMSNISRSPIRLYGEMKVAQICFIMMSSPAEVPYGDKRLGSKYFGQKGPTASKIYLNFDKNEKR
ncbi:dCTP deaminase [Patescibacteria group bacterium]|nr:dCTP deaminase [Patescibacteria group bacterium]